VVSLSLRGAQTVGSTVSGGPERKLRTPPTIKDPGKAAHAAA